MDGTEPSPSVRVPWLVFPYGRGWLSKVDLRALTNFDQQLFYIKNITYCFHKKSYLFEEVNGWY
jgi:hypothetical protein